MKKNRRLSNSNILRGVKASGSISEFARQKGIPRKTMSDWYNQALKVKDTSSKTYVLTCAQIETDVNKEFLENLECYCREMDAELLISGFTYNTPNVAAKGVKNDEFNYDASIRGYLCNERKDLNSNVTWLAGMNTLPTATNPLSGLKTYTKGKSGIFPHPKLCMESVATRQDKNAKTLITTGCITSPNYVQKKAGIKAEFFHSFAAVVVEIVDDNIFHLRHIHAGEDGSFYDLTDYYKGGIRTTGHRVEAITFGDVHREKLDPVVAQSSWGIGIEGRTEIHDSMLDLLKPRHQFFHDLSDFTPRNHHNRGNATWMFNEHHNGKYTVETALKECAEFLVDTSREFCISHVVCSNHDTAFEKWLDEADYKEDPTNALFFLWCQYTRYEKMSRGIQNFDIFEHILGGMMGQYSGDMIRDNVNFLGIEDSYTVKSIECAMHGHVGANGARGNPKSFAQMGVKSNTGHTHSPSIHEGVYTSGVSGKMQMGYNIGPSSWQHAHTVIYPNGKRAILVLIQGNYTNRHVTEAVI